MLWQLETGEGGPLAKGHVGPRQYHESTGSFTASLAGGTERTSVHDSATGIAAEERTPVRTPPGANAGRRQHEYAQNVAARW